VEELILTLQRNTLDFEKEEKNKREEKNFRALRPLAFDELSVAIGKGV
jgi:hypothetical protein